jgi:2-polyprenyl-6-methoxyphenol hydroxylase-like FAD-dependent oxidoreductase
MEIADPEMAQPQRVLVVGGGIAGLATASALLQRGIEADVVERAAAWSDPGTGMYLPANSVRALGSLGLQGPLLDHAYGIERQYRNMRTPGRYVLAGRPQRASLRDRWREAPTRARTGG